MKKLLIIYLASLLLMISCKKSFIELAPISTASVDAVYKTDKDFQDAVLGIYSVLRNQYQDFWIFGDLRADDSWHALGNDAFLVSVNTFSMNSSAPLIINSWRNYYSVVNRANLVLDRIANADPAVVKNKDRHIAEARFLRAFAYFDLVRIWGDVPMTTSPLSINDGYKLGREKVAKIYSDVIIPDLLFAESKLPAKYSGGDVGRVTKGAAMSILGRVYITIKDFAKAEAKLQEVTGMGYALLNNYNDLFDYSKSEHHSEYIFDIEYHEGGLGIGSGFSNKFLPKSAGSAGDIFYGVKGGAGEQNTPTIEFMNAFDPQDKRRDVTVARGYNDNSGVFRGFLQIATFTKKYLAPTAAANDSKVNWKVIRYADVLLMYAEALNENGKTQQAIEYINMIRKRAGLAEYTTLAKEEAREKIYNERRFELGMEGVRWFDLVRTGTVLSVMAPFNMKPHMTVFPIPLVEVQIINDPSVLPQNPGYD
jgi:tetratricopeptide (TPR) repeat protein